MWFFHITTSTAFPQGQAKMADKFKMAKGNGPGQGSAGTTMYNIPSIFVSDQGFYLHTYKIKD